MNVRSTAPGRICLFGEHQDYMSLPVITAAINLVIEIEGTIERGNIIDVSLPDTGKRVVFKTDEIIYDEGKDYIKSGVKVLTEKGLIDSIGVRAVLKGDIPIQAGTSSSSAFTVSWTGFLLASGWTPLKIEQEKRKIAELAYISEVEEFNERGGRMDQYASALGRVNYITFHGEGKVSSLPAAIDGFVLGDSLEPKDTQKTLKRIRSGQEAGLKELKSIYPFKSNFDLNYEEVKDVIKKTDPSVRPYLKAVLLNHWITEEAHKELSGEVFNEKRIAELMNLHHSVLREELNLSTKKIENMITSSLRAGALSAKINGSGEGGCMFAFCPGREEVVAEAIRKAGGTPYILKVHRGLFVEIVE